MSEVNTALEISLTGIVIVLITLSAIPLIIKFNRFILSRFAIKTEEKDKEEKLKSTKSNEKSKLEEVETDDKLSPEELAAISAAVNYFLAEEEKDYKIKSISK